jgi:hypothetical protein
LNIFQEALEKNNDSYMNNENENIEVREEVQTP